MRKRFNIEKKGIRFTSQELVVAKHRRPGSNL
jgi:hypothetical protein